MIARSSLSRPMRSGAVRLRYTFRFQIMAAIRASRE
jgi:hypothetical protein